MSYLLRLSAPSLIRGLPRPVRMISTNHTQLRSSEKLPEYKEVKDFSVEAAEKSKNWVCYGWERLDKEADRQTMKSTFFLAITCIMVFGMTVWAYAPDRQLHDWATREAFLQIRERERAGLPVIDPNYFDPSKLELPSEEELADTEIII